MTTEVEALKQELEEFQNAFLPKDETKLEEAFYTKNIEEWLEFIKNSKTDHLRPSEIIFDYEIIKHAEAFSVGPVFSYNGKMEACSISEYKSLKEMKDHLNGKKYILYYILFSLKTAEFDKESFALKPLDEPEIKYTFRGHILE
jgi:hypothetical protein